MTIRAVYFDLGGVIVRTEFQAPRQRLADRFGMEYEDLVTLVFESQSAAKATLGLISEDEQWVAVTRRLNLPGSEAPSIRDEFFAGDVTDLSLLNFMRGLRKQYKVGLISNAWSGLRPWIIDKKFDDAFDAMIISAEVGVMKPDPRIYQVALEKLGVAPAEAVFLDDFPANVTGARAVGMQAIHFVQPEQALDELRKLLVPEPTKDVG
ncbi:MAG TPA: HAD family phosphatase [Anaerolineales bacterium]|nr:HAD family phosphatase [Anaerolineales bacterium]